MRSTEIVSNTKITLSAGATSVSSPLRADPFEPISSPDPHPAEIIRHTPASKKKSSLHFIVSSPVTKTIHICSSSETIALCIMKSKLKLVKAAQNRVLFYPLYQFFQFLSSSCGNVAGSVGAYVGRRYN